MTTFNYDLIRIGYDGNGVPDDFTVVQGSTLFDGDLPSLSYTIDPVTGAATLTPAPYNTTFSDGADANQIFFAIAEQDWATQTGLSGTIRGMFFSDPVTGNEYYAPLDGDPLPVSSLQDVIDLGFGTVGDPRPITGPLGPGVDILPALTLGSPDYSNLLRTEDDIITMSFDTSYGAFGSSGRDFYTSLENRFDFVIYGELTEAIDMNLIFGWVKKGSLGRDVLVSIEDATCTRFDDRMVGDHDAFGNIFFGGDGDDIMRGKGGADQLEGGNGNDKLFGDDGDDDLLGQGGDDFLFGGLGRDRLDSDRDDDTLDGGEGNDFLFGGAGLDTFVFRDIDNLGLDRIKDWQDGRDTLDVSDFGFSTFNEVAALADDTSNGLRIKFADDSLGNARFVFIENFLKADFDATDVILDIA